MFSGGDSPRSVAPVPRGPSPTRRAGSPHGVGSSPPLPKPTSPMPRKFDDDTRKACWEKAKKILGRDPDRWREDVAGNRLCRAFHGAPGVLGFEYDHIVPFSENGPSTIDNCQVLQTSVSKAKGNSMNFSLDQMKNTSLIYDFDDQALDGIEIFAFGSVKRPGRNCYAQTYERITGHTLPPFGCRCGRTESEDK